MLARYLELVERSDLRGAIDLVARMVDGGAPVEAVVAELLAPAQREVGRRWECRRWNVAQEHAATAIADAALAVITVDEGPSPHGHVVAACVEGEWHGLAARMAAEVLRARGWSVTFLGASVPATDLGDYAAAAAPDAVALSCSMPTVLDGAGRCIRACRDEGLPVLAGGAGFGPGGRYATALGADAWAADAPSGAARLDQWLDTPPADRPPLEGDDEEHRLLMAARAELVTQALGRALSRAASTDQHAGLRAGLELAFAAIESAALVGDPQLLSDAAPMIERALPETVAGAAPLAGILEEALPDLRSRAPGASALVERTLPAISSTQPSAEVDTG